MTRNSDRSTLGFASPRSAAPRASLATIRPSQRPAPGLFGLSRGGTDSGLRASAKGWLVLGGLLLGACSSGSTSGSGLASNMAVFSCVLGCNGPAQGPLNCAVTDVFVNQDFWVEFTQPVDIASVNKNTFQVLNTVTGQTPVGTFTLDPNNNRRVVFRPSLTFDSSGNPVFGLTAGSSYRISIPGVLSDSQGPYIRSVNGLNNEVRLDCFVSASAGINDPVPGAPFVTAILEELSGGQVIDAVLAQGLVDAPLDSRLRFEFSDIMNPATLVNPATGVATFLKVSIDLDGNLNDSSDQLPLTGIYQIAIDEELKQTTVFFTPSGGFPSAGGDPLNPRRVVVDLPPTIVDLGDNPISNAGRVDFTTLAVPLIEEVLADRFEDSTKTDLLRSGTILNPTAPTEQVLYGPNLTPTGQSEQFTGLIRPGLGGGLGRLGDFVAPAGSLITLSTGPTIPTVFGANLVTGPVDLNGDPATDPEDIVAYHVQLSVLDNYAQDMTEPGTATITVDDGVFEFASFIVEAGAILTVIGENPPRFITRGEFQLAGLMDLTGKAAPPQLSNVGTGGAGGLGGPGGGAGGQGADRPDSGGTPLIGTGAFTTLLGFNQPDDAIFQIDGYPGFGRGGETPLPGDDQGGGGGGVHWPTLLPGPLLTQLNGFIANNICSSSQGGTPGAGASYSFFGNAGTWAVPNPIIGVPPGPPLASPGASLLSATNANLDPDAGGRLLGGAGGGGAGVGIINTRSNGTIFNCSSTLPGQVLTLVDYSDHSGAGGGGGGGAIQIQAGRRALVEGRLDLSGGEGGSADTTGNLVQSRFASPGGGGSGGALLIQSPVIALANIAGVVDISGGGGGFNGGIPGMLGGTGGPGIVQLFKSSANDLSLAIEGPKILTYLSTPPASFELDDYISIENWEQVKEGPGAASGYQSCWLAPSGPFFEVSYVADDLSALDPADWTYGWNMKVLIGNGNGGLLGVEDYRGGNGIPAQFLGQDIEALLGNELGSSALVVRFQGVRSTGPIADLCNAELGEEINLLSNSETPWLNSPEEVAAYWDGVLPSNPGLAAKRRANLIRVQVLLDRTAPFAELVLGVVQVTVRCLPD